MAQPLNAVHVRTLEAFGKTITVPAGVTVDDQQMVILCAFYDCNPTRSPSAFPIQASQPGNSAHDSKSNRYRIAHGAYDLFYCAARVWTAEVKQQLVAGDTIVADETVLHPETDFGTVEVIYAVALVFDCCQGYGDPVIWSNSGSKPGITSDLDGAAVGISFISINYEPGVTPFSNAVPPYFTQPTQLSFQRINEYYVPHGVPSKRFYLSTWWSAPSSDIAVTPALDADDYFDVRWLGNGAVGVGTYDNWVIYVAVRKRPQEGITGHERAPSPDKRRCQAWRGPLDDKLYFSTYTEGQTTAATQVLVSNAVGWRSADVFAIRDRELWITAHLFNAATNEVRLLASEDGGDTWPTNNLLFTTARHAACFAFSRPLPQRPALAIALYDFFSKQWFIRVAGIDNTGAWVWSSEQLIVANAAYRMACIKQAPWGGWWFSYVDLTGRCRILECDDLAQDGTGIWVDLPTPAGSGVVATTGYTIFEFDFPRFMNFFPVAMLGKIDPGPDDGFMQQYCSIGSFDAGQWTWTAPAKVTGLASGDLEGAYMQGSIRQAPHGAWEHCWVDAISGPNCKVCLDLAQDGSFGSWGGGNG